MTNANNQYKVTPNDMANAYMAAVGNTAVPRLTPGYHQSSSATGIAVLGNYVPSREQLERALDEARRNEMFLRLTIPTIQLNGISYGKNKVKPNTKGWFGANNFRMNTQLLAGVSTVRLMADPNLPGVMSRYNSVTSQSTLECVPAIAMPAAQDIQPSNRFSLYPRKFSSYAGARLWIQGSRPYEDDTDVDRATILFSQGVETLRPLQLTDDQIMDLDLTKP